MINIPERSYLREETCILANYFWGGSVLSDMRGTTELETEKEDGWWSVGLSILSCIPSRPLAHGVVLSILKADIPLSSVSGDTLIGTPSDVIWVILQLILWSLKLSCDSQHKDTHRGFPCV